MKKVIAAINMTLDGFCDHTSGIPDDEIHQYYADLLRSADTALYGRITYQLMEFWRTVLEKCKISKSRPGGISQTGHYFLRLQQNDTSTERKWFYYAEARV